jgi:hypothetical protein
MIAGIPVALLVTLSPKFYWESFNGDGAHAFEAARLLLTQSLPFWDSAAGDIASFPSINSMMFVYPLSWFIRLFGGIEASVRLPFLLFLSLLFAATVAVIDQGRASPLRQREKALIWLALSTYAVIMSFSATYSPYSADIALPATQDTMQMTLFLGFLLAFLKGEKVWMSLFLGLTYLTSPNGLLILGFFLIAIALAWKPIPWTRLWLVTGGLVASLVITALAPALLSLLNLPAPGSEHGFQSLLWYFAFLQWEDWRRLTYVVLPTGILPALSMLWWRRLDHLGQALVILCLGYFAFFYVQAHISLHHFVPVMLLPLVIYWRSSISQDQRLHGKLLLPLSILTAISFLLALPSHFNVDTSGRVVGSSIENKTPGYDVSSPNVFKSSEILVHLFPFDWDPQVPQELYGGSPLVWNYYSHNRPEPISEVNYVIQIKSDPPPEGMHLIAFDGETSLYLGSEAIWETHRTISPPTPSGSQAYRIPRSILFRSVPHEGVPEIFNVPAWLESIGVDVLSIRDRLGANPD